MIKIVFLKRRKNTPIQVSNWIGALSKTKRKYKLVEKKEIFELIIH